MHNILRLPEIEKRTGLAKSTIYQKIKSGDFPKSVQITGSGAAVGWLESDIIAWQEKIIASRDTAGKAS